MAPIAITPPAVEVKRSVVPTRPAMRRVDTAAMGTRRRFIVFSGDELKAFSSRSWG